MSKYWNQTITYSQITVEELRKKADESVLKAAKKGKVFHPVVVTEKQLAGSWWGQAWCQNIESYADYESRLDRGKRYVKSGAVIDLRIEKGKIQARVQGNRRAPYKIDIRISRLDEAHCQSIIKQCGRKIENLQELVNGNFPNDLKELFLGENGLFPSPREITYNCSSPDWALMCKHVAAALYAVGVRFDENPFLFFELRGIDVNRFIDVTLQDKVEVMLEHVDVVSDRILQDDNMQSVFGIR